MNIKQTIAMWVGITVVVLMGLFPPWNYVCVRRQSIVIPRTSFHYIKDAGYHFLLKPPSHIISDNISKQENEVGLIDLGPAPSHIVSDNTSKQKRLHIDGQIVSEVRLNNQRLLLQYIIALPVLGLLFTFAFGANRHTQKPTSQKQQTPCFSGEPKKPPPGSGFKTSREFMAYLLRGLKDRVS